MLAWLWDSSDIYLVLSRADFPILLRFLFLCIFVSEDFLNHLSKLAAVYTSRTLWFLEFCLFVSRLNAKSHI